MTTFTEHQQKKHRDAFIDECHQKAWSAACHADFISNELDKLLENYSKLKAEDETLAEEIKTLETALDGHTKDNRDKRKALQERRNALTKEMEAIGQRHTQGQQALAGLYQSIETNLALATHAQTWEWKEVESTTTASADDETP